MAAFRNDEFPNCGSYGQRVSMFGGIQVPVDPEIIKEAVQLFSEGVSYGKIGLKLGKSRSAIAGIVYRHGEKRGTPPTQNIARPKSQAQLRKEKDFERKLREQRILDVGEPTPIGPKGKYPENGGCQFMHGDPATKHWCMCAHPKGVESAYCDFHYLALRKKDQPADTVLAMERKRALYRDRLAIQFLGG